MISKAVKETMKNKGDRSI